MMQTLSSFWKRSARYLILGILAVSLLGGTGCKSKKKAAEAAAAAEDARLAREAAERKRAEEEEAARRRAEEERLAAERARAAAEENSPENRLTRYFDAIASSSSTTSADRSIQEALSLFASPDTPVLVIISEEAGQKDYDRPTTIREYLNYLKDTKNNMSSIDAVKYDASGKITELELRKEL